MYAKILRKNKGSIVIEPLKDAMYDDTNPSLKTGIFKISNEGIREFKKMRATDPLVTRTRDGICDNFISMQSLITLKNGKSLDVIEISDDLVWYGIKMGYITHQVKKEVQMKITSTEYIGLEDAYNFLNKELFNNELPGCLITMQSKSKSAGFYSPDQFISRKGEKDKNAYTDEISLNPATFKQYSDVEILSTMVHEMCHLWQNKFGKPSRTGYHNKEWAAKMESVGLMPSSTGEPGGRKVGQKMCDYVIKGGVFEKKSKELIQKGFRVNWESFYQITKSRPQPGPGIKAPLGEVEAEEDKGRSKEKNKVKYSCPVCRINAWGKPGLKLICGQCKLSLVS